MTLRYVARNEVQAQVVGGRQGRTEERRGWSKSIQLSQTWKWRRWPGSLDQPEHWLSYQVFKRLVRGLQKMFGDITAR